MAKVNIKSEKITPLGGIYYASKAFEFQSPMGKGALCPNLKVFGFLSCRYAYACDKNLKNIRKDFVC